MPKEANKVLFKNVSDIVTEQFSQPSSILEDTKFVSSTTYNIPIDLKRGMNKIHNTVCDESTYKEVVDNSIQAFNKYKIAYPDMQLGRGIPYVFFTRPDLNIFQPGIRTGSTVLTSSTKDDPVFSGLSNSDPLLLNSLTSLFSREHDFNPFLSNMASSFDLSDETIDTLTTGDTFTGWRVKYGKHNINFKSSGSFSVSYTDTAQLQIYKIHKAWVEYISKVYRGELDSKRKYITERRLDYACSAYYFICAPDGETILYWAKYVGVFPSSVPTGALSWSKGSVIQSPDVSVTYEYSWKSDMELPIIRDFNYNSKITDSTDTSILKYSESYYDEIVGCGYTFANAPYISIGKDSSGKYSFKLRFKELIVK